MPAGRNARGIQDTPTGLRVLWDRYNPATIGLAIGGNRGHDSSLTHDSYLFLADALGPEAESRFVSAAPLIEEVFDTRLPGELEHYRQLVLATDVIAQTALSNVVITPGVTQARTSSGSSMRPSPSWASGASPGSRSTSRSSASTKRPAK